MVVTQTYSYMANSGISHGYIVTGEIMILLFIQEHEPENVYFYYADPRAEVELERRTSSDFPYECTSVAQLVSFCVMAHGVP